MIYYLVGDATIPQNPNKPTVIAHVCNNIGGWGAGFVIPLGKRYPTARDHYVNGPYYILGTTQFVEVGKMIWVANMTAQSGYRSEKDLHPLRLDALKKCLTTVDQFAEKIQGVVQMPLIGCGLAGGNWETEVEPLVKRMNSDVYVCRLL